MYLIIGEDGDKKESALSALKQKILNKPDAFQFDYDTFHGSKLEASVLKKSLLSLPAVAKKRFILIHNSHKLSSQNKQIIHEFLKERPLHAVLILESNHWTGSDAFVKKIKPFVKINDLGTSEKSNVFDVTRAMSRRRPAEAVKILAGLMEEGTHPLQIMGGLVWFWGKSRPKMAPASFEQGLLALQEADLNIKRSRLRADYSMELVIVKLCAILG